MGKSKGIVIFGSGHACNPRAELSGKLGSRLMGKLLLPPVPKSRCHYQADISPWLLKMKRVRVPNLSSGSVCHLEGAHSQVKSASVSHLVVSDSSETSWTAAHQAPLSMEFSRQEYWSGLPFPFPGNLPDPGINQTWVSCIVGRFFTIWATSEGHKWPLSQY